MLTQEDIIHEINQYSPEDRVRIVQAVLNGVVKPAPETEQAWLDAAAERCERYKCGVAKTVYRKSENISMNALKDEVVNLVQELPESATLDDILAEIYFKAQVDAGLRELDKGKGIPHEVVEKRMSKWLTV